MDITPELLEEVKEHIRRLKETADYLAYTEELYGFADECNRVRGWLERVFPQAKEV